MSALPLHIIAYSLSQPPSFISVASRLRPVKYAASHFIIHISSFCEAGKSVIQASHGKYISTFFSTLIIATIRSSILIIAMIRSSTYITPTIRSSPIISATMRSSQPCIIEHLLSRQCIIATYIIAIMHYRQIHTQQCIIASIYHRTCIIATISVEHIYSQQQVYHHSSSRQSIIAHISSAPIAFHHSYSQQSTIARPFIPGP